MREPSGPAVLLAALLTAAAVQAQVAPIQIDHDVTINGDGILSDRFTWRDSLGQPRVAVLAHNDGAAGPNGSRGGAMREFRYQLPNTSTRIANVTTYGNSGYSGFGYVVDHSNAGNCIGDDSPLGFAIAGTWTRVFEGRHHAIFRFQQNYPRNCPNQTRYIPVTYDFIFSTGRDNPVYAITYDVGAAAAADVLNDDSRAPYGELNIDGDGSTNIDGVAWGDRYKFTSTSAPVSLSSSWTYNVANTVPYVKEWIVSTDATMGLVLTQTMDQQDAGGGRNQFYHDITLLWNKTSATIPGNGYCAGYTMPCQNEWAYQANADSIGVGVSNNNARLTWGTQYGFLGQTLYDAHDPGMNQLPGYPKKSYSVYIVLGTHSSGPIETQITQIETVQSLALTASTGSVLTIGPAGVNRAENVTYAPAGYNHIYGALAFSASSNQLDANIAVGAGTLKRPLIIVSNYSAGDPQVSFGGTLLTADVDYFASLRPAANELWLTLNRDLAGGTNHLVVGASGPPAAPVGVSAAAITNARVDVAWTAVGGATSYQVDRKSPGGGFVQIGTPMANAFSDTTVAADTAYLYRVRAVNGSGPSANSVPDLATTVIFTDAALGGVEVKAIHLSQLRTAVDAVRSLAGQGTGGYTDTAAAGTTIKAIHVTELRTALDSARGALSLSTGGYTDGALAGIAVKAIHFQELRDRVQ
jgi:hypothetical protein